MASDDTDPTEEMVKKEIADALKIFKEDHVHAKLAGLREFLLGDSSKPADGGDDSTEGKAPPASDTPKESNGEKKAKKGLWWGDRA